LSRKKRMLVLGPSFRRKKKQRLMPAFLRFDGIFYRVARKHLKSNKDVDIVVMKDDLTLINGGSPLAYTPPKGKNWEKRTFSEEKIKNARMKNEAFLDKRIKPCRYSELFIAMGKSYAQALPGLSKYDFKVIFPKSGGIGPKAGALKMWLVRSEIQSVGSVSL
jgi:hypothetical protein